MVWVKKVFGVVLLSIGLFYAALAFAPKLSFWIGPLALLLGGIYLGFIDRSQGRTPAFGIVKRVGGAAAVIAGGVMVAALLPKGAMEFEAYDEASLRAALEQGRPVLMDFSADWCVPCHELEHFTFTDRRVIAASADFERFKVDLTRYDSAESEQLRSDYEITGVPTIVFLTPDGREVRAARVEGFLPADDFLERMRTAVSEGPRAQR
jgi:thiol:disulfide interchange protein DsbD